MEKVWDYCLFLLKQKIDKEAFETWIKPIEPVKIEDNVFYLKVPNRFFKIWLEENYVNEISSNLSFIKGEKIKISFIIEESEKAFLESNDYLRYEKDINIPYFNPSYSFENFVVGPSNQLAHAACQAVASFPSKAYNPLFIYGGVGLGKTHLLNAIGLYVYKNKIIPKEKICFISSEEFTSQLIDAIRYEKTHEFRKKFRNMDIFLVDDVQFLSNKEMTQVEFFHAFNALFESNKQIVLTSDLFPKDIPNLEERLKSRFEWGLITDIQPPDVETKVAILKKKAGLNRIPLPDDVAFYLASSIDSNIRTLEGSLIRLSAFSSLSGSPISLSMAKEILKNIIKEKDFFVDINKIQKVVSSFFNIKLSTLIGKRKQKNVVFPRQIGIYLARKLTNLSLMEIGERFGGKDHSTVIHSIRKIEKRVNEESSLKDLINILIERIKLSKY
ncbi:MAG: chromosomal replication initiator protein DnaA [Deltaproteobacteria bacterium]|nr:chromosomal replication initiator protein DnaA [Deltaproteobacteria bacterium]RLA91379.1 MAG: chromosomal replication initiator protein DnaA [Deltaproteobacteria bacterium]